MAPRKATTKTTAKKGALEGFHSVEAVPTARRRSWATAALDEFLAGDDKVIACSYGDDRKAIGKQASLNKAVKGDPYAGKVKIHRRGDTVYLERI